MKHFSPLWSLFPGASLIIECGNPSEKDNVAATHPEMVKELSALL